MALRIVTVIQSVLFFTLGFLCAGFLALMVAPALWRRAVRLTRRRIEAAVPLSLTEIQADKDQMRAEFAMSTRRLEMNLKDFRDKAAAQIVEINRNRDELLRLEQDRLEKTSAIGKLEAEMGQLRADVLQREEELQRQSARASEIDKALSDRNEELRQVGRLYEEASLASSNKQIELAVRETEVERLHGDLGGLREQRRESERRVREMAAEAQAAREQLSAEKSRSADLAQRVERMLTTLADREEKLDRREREIVRMREAQKQVTATENELGVQLTAAQNDKMNLEMRLADVTLQMSTLLSGAKGGDVQKALGRIQEEKERMEVRLAALARENKKLRFDLAAVEKVQSDDWSDERQGNALLREQINDLAAEVVAMTAALEGPGSPIEKALASPSRLPSSMQGADRVVSLADRVRAIQQAARGQSKSESA